MIGLSKKSGSKKENAGTWIKGSRYAEYFLAENRHPTRLDLDQVSPQHPVIIYHTSFHACVLNSMAIKMLGLSHETASPQGGIIEKDPDTGDPTGVLHDEAMMDVFNTLFFEDLAAMSKQERIDLCAGATESYAKLGFVFAADALVVPQTLDMYQDTLAAGRLNIRIYTMNLDDKAEPLTGSRIRTGFGPDLAHQLYPFKSMLNAGMKIGGSSDCPVSNLDPRIGLRDAVIRRSPSGEIIGPQETLTMEEAIRLYTQGAAYLSFDETRNGSIEIGKRADFTVMAADPRQVSPEEVPEIPISMTVVGGEIVHSE